MGGKRKINGPNKAGYHCSKLRAMPQAVQSTLVHTFLGICQIVSEDSTSGMPTKVSVIKWSAPVFSHCRLQQYMQQAETMPWVFLRCTYLHRPHPTLIDSIQRLKRDKASLYCWIMYTQCVFFLWWMMAAGQPCEPFFLTQLTFVYCIVPYSTTLACITNP